MRFNILRFVMIAAAIQLVGLVSGCVTHAPLSLRVDTPQEGAVLDSNVVRVAGKVNNAASSVVVDNVTATVSADGSFSAWVGLQSGNSTITVAAKLGTMVSEMTRSVSFDPPLVVFLSDEPKLEPGVDYTRSPVTFVGMVSNAEATVKVNGVAVAVDADGTFSAQVRMGEGSNRVEAIATLGDESDSEAWTYWVELGNIGRPVIAPGQNIQDLSGFSFLQSSVQLDAGESDSIAITFHVGKELTEPWTFEQSVASPEGFSVSLEPSEFLAYPDVTYHEAITVTTGRALQPGEYALFLWGFYQGKRMESARINVEINPPHG